MIPTSITSSHDDQGSSICLKKLGSNDLLNHATVEGKTYARDRYKNTGQHYLMTNEGHVWLDCRHNRKAVKESEMQVVWTTRQK